MKKTNATPKRKPTPTAKIKPKTKPKKPTTKIDLPYIDPDDDDVRVIGVAKITSKVKPKKAKPKKTAIKINPYYEMSEEFFYLARTHKRVIVFSQRIEKTFYFVIACVKKLTVTTHNNASIFQPRENVEESEYNLISMVRIGIKTSDLPDVIFDLHEIGVKITPLITMNQVHNFFSKA